MIPSVCFCFLFGLALGVRYRIYMLVPASAAAVLLAVGAASVTGSSLLGSFGLIVLLPSVLQAGYAAALAIQVRFPIAGRVGVHTS